MSRPSSAGNRPRRRLVARAAGTGLTGQPTRPRCGGGPDGACRFPAAFPNNDASATRVRRSRPKSCPTRFDDGPVSRSGSSARPRLHVLASPVRDAASNRVRDARAPAQGLSPEPEAAPLESERTQRGFPLPPSDFSGALAQVQWSCNVVNGDGNPAVADGGYNNGRATGMYGSSTRSSTVRAEI